MSNSQAQALSASFATLSAIIWIVVLLSIVLSVVIYWRIFSKAGYNGALSLLMFVPIANIIMLCVLAFGEWPIYQELNALRQRVSSMPPQYPQYPQNPPQYPQNPPQYPPTPNPQYRP
jgi:heme/copper-type cytochrome/quinol oxidase subunit 2